jgi:hypothetical protein
VTSIPACEGRIRCRWAAWLWGPPKAALWITETTLRGRRRRGTMAAKYYACVVH